MLIPFDYLVGCIGLAMVPLPFIFYVYGARIRKYSKYATSACVGVTPTETDGERG